MPLSYERDDRRRRLVVVPSGTLTLEQASSSSIARPPGTWSYAVLDDGRVRWDIGWTARGAQSQPDFELVVNAPAGATSIECRRGCQLLWVERGPNPNAAPQQTFDFTCSGATAASCSSGRVGGLDHAIGRDSPTTGASSRPEFR